MLPKSYRLKKRSAFAATYKTGKVFHQDGITVFAGKNKDNDCSTIALLSYKDFDMLFMGDAGTKSFKAVKKDIPHNVEVLKVGHHGADRKSVV